MIAQQSCLGHLTISVPLNKVLTYDLMRLTKSHGTSFDNDAAGCYDRIVPPHALLCCCRMGFPSSPSQMLTKVLQQTIYKLKTGHGLSKDSYFSTLLRRILGIGQGPGSSPCIWTCVLDPIMVSVLKKNHLFPHTKPLGYCPSSIR